MLYATEGIDKKEDFDKAMVGVASVWCVPIAVEPASAQPAANVLVPARERPSALLTLTRPPVRDCLPLQVRG